MAMICSRETEGAGGLDNSILVGLRCQAILLLLTPPSDENASSCLVANLAGELLAMI